MGMKVSYARNTYRMGNKLGPSGLVHKNTPTIKYAEGKPMRDYQKMLESNAKQKLRRIGK